MRIISGKFRGKNILAPADLPVRPTTDFAKTGLFNILANHIDFSKVSVLDLFAGTGNITYEFISRGCNCITAVDADKRCINFIERTKKNLNAPFLKTIPSDVFHFLKRASGSYDVIFADPPFEFTEDSKLIEGVFQSVGADRLLKENGLFIYEHSEKKDVSHFDHFVEKRKYGAVAFSFFQNKLILQ